MGDNLFSPEYTQGNLAEIGFIAQVIGRIAVVVISIVGFGIIMAAILKNALHGLYAVSPKFWDRVDEAHKVSLGFSSSSGGNQISKVVGSITIVFLNILPNVKALTDFDDEVLDAKAYFMKAIPLLCVQIFVGVFIFFGYPAQVAEKFSDFGRGFFDVVLMNVDPTAWVQSIPKKMIILDLSTDGSKDDVDITINKIARSVYTTYVGELDDMTSEKRNEVSRLIEQWVIQNTSQDYVTFCDTDKYAMSVTSRISIAEPDISRVGSSNGNNKDGIYAFAYYTPLATWEHGSTKDAEGKYVRYDLVFTPVASKGNTSSVENVMNAMRFSKDNSANKITITVADEVTTSYGLTGLSRITGTVSINGNDVKVNLALSENTIIVTPAAGSTSITDATVISNISGLYYFYGSSKHAIRSIMQGGSGSRTTSFVPVNENDQSNSWVWGEQPTSKSKTEVDEKETPKQTKDDKTNSGSW